MLNRAAWLALALGVGCAAPMRVAPEPLMADARCRVWIEGLDGPQRPMVVENERAVWQDAFGPTPAARFGRDDEIVEPNAFGRARLGRYADRTVYLEALGGADGYQLHLGDGEVGVPEWPVGQHIRFNGACSVRQAALGVTSVFLRRESQLRKPLLER
jgi:hypothetical protein